MSTITALRAQPALYPMQSPFESARRRSSTAENVLLAVTLASGTTGFGEASPAEYVTGETPEGVLAALRSLEPDLAGQDVSRVQEWAPRLEALLPGQPTARSAVEMALLDAHCRELGISLTTYFGGALREARSDLTIPIAPPERAGALAAGAAALGYRSLKIKVGGPDRGADLERVRAVSRAAPGAGIRLDANQGFGVDETLAFLAGCLESGVPIELVEQPVHRDDWEGLAEVTRRSPVPVIADEAVVDARAALRIAASGAAHGINIKVAKAGLLGALPIIAIARTAGLKLMLGCMLESLLGIGASLHLACGTGAFNFLDLDSHALIGLQPGGHPFAQEGEVLRPAELPGIGWAPEGAGGE